MWYNKGMAEYTSTSGLTFEIPELGQPANIVTAFQEFSNSIDTMTGENSPIFSGLLNVQDVNSGVILTNTHTNSLLVFPGAGTFDVDPTMPIGWNAAVVHLGAEGDVLSPSLSGGQQINWNGSLGPFTIVSMVKVTDTQIVSTFGGA